MIKRMIAACALSAAALGTAACSGTAQATPPTAGPVTNTSGSTSTAQAPGSTASASASTAQAQASTGSSSNSTGAAAASVPACGTDDLKIGWGYGTQSDPLQASAVVFENISSHTCTLQGYPGAAIKDGGTVINATRELNIYRGTLPPLSSPPLVTLAPRGVSYSVVEWMLHTNQSCYPNGTGSFEITAPNTTKTVVISSTPTNGMGLKGICSAYEVSPVVPGVFGVAVGNF